MTGISKNLFMFNANGIYLYIYRKTSNAYAMPTVMKKSNLLIIIMLVSIMAKAQDITLKFSAHHTCTHHAIDSIWIENLTQDGKMVLYYPDTIASFVLTDIEEFDPWNNHLHVSQNYPNPFSDITYIDVYLTTPDVVSLNVFDMTGRIVAKHQDMLDGGMHRFSFSAGMETTYILTVTSGKHVEKRIMLQMGLAGSVSSELSYLGASSEEEPKTEPKSSDFNFSPGDDLRFTGYVTDSSGNVDHGVINDAPEASTEYFFDIANTLPGQPSEVSGEDDVPENATTLHYEVEEVEGLTYLWSVPEGWEITQGQGSHAITVDAGSDGGEISVKAENNCGVSEASVLSVSVYTPDSDGMLALLAGQESKEWKLYRIGTSMGVGPDVYIPRVWWALENDGSRPCVYFHTFTFHQNGDFVFDDHGAFWGEYGIFEGTDVHETCFEAIPANMINMDGVDVSALLSGTHQFELDSTTNIVTLNGYGAWMGMPQLTTTDEESSVPVDSKQFKIESIEEHEDYDLMIISYTYEDLYWDFSYAHYHNPDAEPEVVEDEEGLDPLDELTPTEMFNTFASESEEDVQILVPTESTVQLTVGVDDPDDPDATKVGEYHRVAEHYQELQFETGYYIQFDNFTTVSLDVFVPGENDFSGGLTKEIAIIISNNYDTPEWWTHHLQYDVDPEDVVLDEWQTWTFQLDEPTSGPGIPEGTPNERSDLNFFAITIGGAGHADEGTFYIRNFIFDGDDDNGDFDIIQRDGVTDIDGNEYVTVINCRSKLDGRKPSGYQVQQ